MDVAAIHNQEINSGPKKSLEFHPLLVTVTAASQLLIGQQKKKQRLF
jgi:hypothetical protein